MANTRMPTQKRSIEKRNKIIEKGFDLICEKGYHNISTPDIAKAAGVSTGIIYQYFTDKKEIFIEGVKAFSNNIMFPLHDLIENQNLNINNVETIVKEIIDLYIKNHAISKKAHEELMAMSHLDEDISNIFISSEFDLTHKIVELLNKNNITIKNPTEKIHIAIAIIENYCHEIVYHKHDEINYSIMEQEVINLIINLIKN